MDSKLIMYVIAIALVIVIIYKLATPASEGIVRIPVPGLAPIQGFSASMVSPMYRKASLNTGY